MVKLVIIEGLPASGKSTLTKTLSKELQIAIFHADIFKVGEGSTAWYW